MGVPQTLGHQSGSSEKLVLVSSWDLIQLVSIECPLGVVRLLTPGRFGSPPCGRMSDFGDVESTSLIHTVSFRDIALLTCFS